MADNQQLPPLNREVFVLRLWNSFQTRSWVGEIQNVHSGQIVHVHGPKELLAYIQSQMEPPDPEAQAGE